jgi:hypothetical protein
VFESFTKFFEANDNHKKPKKAPENTKMPFFVKYLHSGPGCQAKYCFLDFFWISHEKLSRIGPRPNSFFQSLEFWKVLTTGPSTRKSANTKYHGTATHRKDNLASP